MPAVGNALQSLRHGLLKFLHEQNQSSRVLVSYIRWFGAVPDLGPLPLVDGAQLFPSSGDGTMGASPLPCVAS